MSDCEVLVNRQIAIAKMVVAQHRGTIEAKSELGKGTNVIIRLLPSADRDVVQ